VVSFTPRPLYPRGKRPRYPFDRTLGGPQSRSGRRGEEKILGPYLGSNSDPSAIQSVASRYTDCAIPAPLSAHRNSTRQNKLSNLENSDYILSQMSGVLLQKTTLPRLLKKFQHLYGIRGSYSRVRKTPSLVTILSQINPVYHIS
jgi:hypothetical protein